MPCGSAGRRPTEVAGVLTHFCDLENSLGNHDRARGHFAEGLKIERAISVGQDMSTADRYARSTSPKRFSGREQ